MAVILVAAAHPDDEILGVGGTLARHAAAGDTVHVLIAGEGVTSRGPAAEGELAALHAAAKAAAAAVGAREPVLLNLPDNRFDSLDQLDLVQRIEKVLDAVRPDTVYTHHGADVNVDHRLLHQAVVTATRPLPGSGVRRLYAFETVSSTEWATDGFGPAFRPQRYVDVSAFMERKMQALAAYASEMRPFPHARSLPAVEALARLRGSQCGVAAAEAFQVLREIEV